MPFEVGQCVGDYEILAVVGKGGMGRVYQVRHVISKRIEALKVLLEDLSAEGELGDRFISEIRTLARLDHPNIAKFHTAFKAENQLVMVMEFIEGFSLSDRAKQGPIPLDEVLSYVTQMLAALSCAHASGVIHRDIKPSNIMVTSHGIVKLMDFGIAKSNAETMLTRPGTTMGSMLYMSPEQVRGTTADARSDLYSAGVVLYELSSGHRPFEAESTFAILDAQLNTVPKPPIELNPTLPKPLNDIIMTALSKEPMHRFQSADAFRNALESVRGRQNLAQTVLLPNSSAQAQPRDAAQGFSPKSNRGLWMAAGAVACVCVLAGGAYMLPHFWRSSAASKTGPAAGQAPTSSLPATVVAQPAPALSTPLSSTPAPQNQTDNPSGQAAPERDVASSPQPLEKPLTKPVARKEAQSVTVAAVPATQQVVTPAQVLQPAGPSQEEIEKESDELTKAHARADAVNGTLSRLRQQQAADGLELRQDMVAAASRLDSYLQAADRALQTNNLESARKNRERAEQELNKLETFTGR